MKQQIAELKQMIASGNDDAMNYLAELTTKCNTDEDRAELTQLANNLLSESAMSINDIETEVEDYTLKEKLGELANVVNFAYVARVYFGKSRTWLYQRLNGYLVNGKKAMFTTKEKETLNNALNDIGQSLLKFTAQ